jgi:preprotein translocase subunit SecG
MHTLFGALVVLFVVWFLALLSLVFLYKQRKTKETKKQRNTETNKQTNKQKQLPAPSSPSA